MEKSWKITINYQLIFKKCKNYWKVFKKCYQMAEKIGKKEENIQNPGTRVLRFKNPNPFFVKNPGTQPGLGTRVKTLYFSEDGRSSLWYTQRAWRISWKESYGGTACNAYVTSESNCPDQSFNWRFHSYDLNSWYDAGKSLGIWYRS